MTDNSHSPNAQIPNLDSLLEAYAEKIATSLAAFEQSVKDVAANQSGDELITLGRSVAARIAQSNNLTDPLIFRELGELSQLTWNPTNNDERWLVRQAFERFATDCLGRAFSSNLWLEKEITVDAAQKVSEGGNNWIVPIYYRGQAAVLATPKMRGDEIPARYQTRKLGTDLAGNGWFSVPSVIEIFDLPRPACVMKRVGGANCYNLAFDGPDNRRTDDSPQSDSILVFKTLGAIGFTLGQRRALGFGSPRTDNGIISGEFNTLAKYISAAVAPLHHPKTYLRIIISSIPIRHGTIRTPSSMRGLGSFDRQ
jgi:hypothetical protein